jgi:hypothetical protein
VIPLSGIKTPLAGTVGRITGAAHTSQPNNIVKLGDPHKRMTDTVSMFRIDVFPGQLVTAVRLLNCVKSYEVVESTWCDAICAPLSGRKLKKISTFEAIRWCGPRFSIKQGDPAPFPVKDHGTVHGASNRSCSAFGEGTA